MKYTTKHKAMIPTEVEARAMRPEFAEVLEAHGVLTPAPSYEQLAQALGVPVGTVKSRLNRARKQLAQIRELDAPKACTYPRCKCIVMTSTSQPEPDCPLGLERAEETPCDSSAR